MIVNSSSASPLRIEGYGPGGAAVLIECVVDDAGSLRARVREMFRHHGGYLGAAGSVEYLFDRVGRLRFGAGVEQEQLKCAAFAAGAEEVLGETDRSWVVLTDPRELTSVQSRLADNGLTAQQADVILRAALTRPLTGVAAERMRALLAALARLEGVRNVYSNAEISDAFLANL